MRNRLISIAIVFILGSSPLALAKGQKDHRSHTGQELAQAVSTKREMV